jgi:single-stranded DNA-binding protein
LKERRLMINSVFLLGTIASEIEVPFSDKEHQAVSAVCVCGKRVRMTVPIAPMVPRVAWGKAAEVLGDLAEGDTLVVEGKLRWVKRGKSGVLEYGLAGPSRTACWSRGWGA